MKLLLATLLTFLLSTTLLAQDQEPFCGDGNLDPGEACDDGNTESWDGCSALCVGEASEDVELYREMMGYKAEKDRLLHAQQEFSASAKRDRLDQANALIAKWEAKRDEAGDNDRLALAARIQERIDKLIAARDWYDSDAPGSPSDEASNLGTQISQLSQVIGQIAEQLGIPEPE